MKGELPQLGIQNSGQMITANQNFFTATPITAGAIKKAISTGLAITFLGGALWTGSAWTTTADQNPGTLTVSAINYVERDPTTGAITKNTSAFTAGKQRLYTLQTTASGIDYSSANTQDYRSPVWQEGHAKLEGLLTRSDVTIGMNTAATNRVLNITRPVGQQGQINFQTSGSNRWILMGANATAESGSNAGSDFQLLARDDTGAGIDTPLTITRVAAGKVSWARPLQVTLASSNAQLNLIRTGTSTANVWVWAAADRLNIGPDSAGSPGAAVFNLNVANGQLTLATSEVDYIKNRFGQSFTSGGSSTVSIGMLLDGTVTGAVGDTSRLSHFEVGPTGTVTQTATENINVVTTAHFAEPNITNNLTGTINIATTIYVPNAPTEGVRNASIYIAKGSLWAMDDTTSGGVVRIGSTVTGAVSTDVFGTLAFFSADTTSPGEGDWASISVVAVGAMDGSATSGTDMVFKTGTYGSGRNTEKLRLDRLGNIGLNTSAFGTNAAGVLGILNAATVPGSSPANMIQMYSKDSSLGSANATLAMRTEQAVEAIGTFTASHKLRVWINEVEYHIQLDAV